MSSRVAPVASPKGSAPGQTTAGAGHTRAVVIGISDYQDASIPDLRFADRDARIFADFLRSSANVPNEHLRLLTNEQATMAQMAAAFDWLVDETHEGDLAVIYFSGHGDVEIKTRNQMGFLLPWDSPPAAYMARAFPIYYLQEIISTLSLDNKAHVLLVADACRSGKLAGSAINGGQLTNANLARQFASEIKILSCQPGEYSFESEKWGGGRGVFSYFLVEGLYGLADRNNDGAVNLSEIDRFLEDHVSAESAPNSQIPMSIGLKTEVVAQVKSELLAMLKSGDHAGMLAAAGDISPAGDKGQVPPEWRAVTAAFQKSLGKDLAFNRADSLFRLLEKQPALAGFRAEFARSFAAAIQDEVNQALNALLESDPYELNKFLFNPQNYGHYPEHLARAIELLGADNLLVPSLRVKKLYFEAYNVIKVFAESDKFEKPQRDSLRRVAHGLMEKAIAIEPEAAWLHHGNAYFYTTRVPSRLDSVVKYSQTALRFSPNWPLPWLTMASEYLYNLHDYPKAEACLMEASRAKPGSYVVAERLAWLYLTVGPNEKALEMADKMIALRPELFNGYGTKGGFFFQKFDFREAANWYTKAAALDTNAISWVNFYLGYALMAPRQVEEGRQVFEAELADERMPYWMRANYKTWYAKGLINFTRDLPRADALLADAFHERHLPSDVAEVLIWQAKSRFLQGQFGESHSLLDRALAYDTLPVSAFILAYSLMGELALHDGDASNAEKFFIKGTNYPGDNFFKEEAIFRYGVFLLKQNRPEEARAQFGFCPVVTSGKGYFGDYGLALLAAQKGDAALALDYLEKSLVRWLPLPDLPLNEPLFGEIRKTERYSELMKKHFPKR